MIAVLLWSFLLLALASCPPQVAGPLGMRETDTDTHVCQEHVWPQESTARITHGHRENSRAGRRRGAAPGQTGLFSGRPGAHLQAPSQELA